MKSSRISGPLVVLVLVVATVLLPVLIGHASKSFVQDSEKTLTIRRNADEPLELVDIKISEQSVTHNIKVKSRNGDEGRHGLDTVNVGKSFIPQRISFLLTN